ncbi:SOS-response transcriptional repressor [Segniliparus rotundus DSM 44985]|uniref:SOS-response transcriptional repressor n=1 Tax=Segniliparus rotundus (strain ATCC BAA-972 / CDC 1076 / CIP 108378 / DSM 44985 / JCM 13578) TaxID=640132 RepID=D6ZFQ0_SEGRD|nr:S24 family peptidase [Segniliparus rotundus]ADG97774.1 SOS-response transcriptional repressor [Segniliparus rotundus DSM 44985]
MDSVERVFSGWPSPAADYEARALDLSALVAPRPAATFYWRARGDALSGSGVLPDSLLVVDRSLEPRLGSVVVASAGEGGFVVTRLREAAVAAPDAVWGMVTWAITRVR